MARRTQYPALRVLQNGRFVGLFRKEPGGTVSFRYDPSWLARKDAVPISLSLPLREDDFRGGPVSAVFENLLPDVEALRQRIAEKVGADGADAYSLLARIGRDCVGALQFIGEGDALVKARLRVEGEPVSESEIEKLLANLARTPLGLERGQDFRISVAGAQEKTALLHYKGKWLKPRGATPTTHILKPQIGKLPNGLDLSNSVENEFYCLKLISEFGLAVSRAEIGVFGDTKALVIERFDRRWTREGVLVRLPQEDCCQALSCPPGRKYQNEGGPGMVDILRFLKGADVPTADQKTFLKAQILFWLIGATDGHAKNFSVFLGAGGRFRMTPLYDVMSAQPSIDSRHVERKQMKLAMFVGKSRHYRVDEIRGRHFVQTTEAAGLPATIASEVLKEILETAPGAVKAVGGALPPGFPRKIHISITSGLRTRLARMDV